MDYHKTPLGGVWSQVRTLLPRLDKEIRNPWIPNLFFYTIK